MKTTSRASELGDRQRPAVALLLNLDGILPIKDAVGALVFAGKPGGRVDPTAGNVELAENASGLFDEMALHIKPTSNLAERITAPLAAQSAGEG